MIIKYLPQVEAQKIAAGEVVERPANIIKELVENALDAGSTKITITVEEGGKRLLSIEDNGSGMVIDDARICFLRHTTSKLTTFDQLQDITTFGFRGEALASICSVAKVTIVSRHSSAVSGIKLSIQDGAIVTETVVGSAIGTTIVAEDLFYNLPARKKFLKSTTTELNQIIQLFKAFCLGRLDVHFVLVHNTSQVYNCPAVAALQERIAQLFDIQTSKQLVPFNQTQTGNVSCAGVVTMPTYGRYDRSGIYLFVNQRWVKNYPLIQAIIKGYSNVLPHGKYPLAVCTITLDPHEVDSNVHPKKEEVGLLHPRMVESLITQAVNKALEHYSSTISGRPLLQHAPQSFGEKFEHSGYAAPQKYSFGMQEHFQIRNFVVQEDTVLGQLEKPYISEPNNLTQSVKNKEDNSEHTEQLTAGFADDVVHDTPLSSLVFLGQLHATYLMLEHPDGLLMVDQHAAHERIIYERLAANFTNQETITLLFPEIVTCSADDMHDLLGYVPLLEQHGIICEQYSPTQFVVRGKSVNTQSIDVHELLQQILGWVKDFGKADVIDVRKYVTEKMRAQIACKAAIKAGDSMTPEKVYALLKDLEQVNNRFTCPHGRPTSWLLPQYDIEKKFKRKL